MGTKLVLFVALVFIILIALGVYTYFKFEKPAQKDVVEYADLNIYAMDKNDSTQQNIVTNFNLYADGTLYKNGSTVLGGGTLVRVPINKSVILINKNTENQHYYANLINLYTDKLKSPYRLIFQLVNSGDITITQNGTLDRNQGPLSVTLTSIGYVNKLDFCIDWGTHIIKVSTNSTFQEIDKPQRLEKYYRCYSSGVNLDNSNITIPLNYMTFGDLNDNDYIKLVFLDEDYVQEKNNYSPEGANGEDIAKKDVEYEIKINNQI